MCLYIDKETIFLEYCVVELLGQRLWAFLQSKFGSQVSFSIIHARSCWFVASFLWRGWTIIMSNCNLWWVSSQLAHMSLCECGSHGLYPELILPPPAQSSLWTLERGPFIHNELPVGKRNNGGSWDAGWICQLYADGCVSHSVSHSIPQLALEIQVNCLLSPQMSFLSGWGEKDNECLLDEAINLYKNKD